MMARQPGKIISWARNLLIGRTVEATPWVRAPHEISPRSPPPPNLPPGVNHRLSLNYYYDRDARRVIQPPSIVAVNPTLLKAGATSSTETTTPQIPGTGHSWVWRET
ncbi:hypothetical protein EMCRGX_G019958 [Ephydatia muelleri]